MNSVEKLGGFSYFVQWQGTKMFEIATWARMMKESFDDMDQIRADIAQNGTWMNDTTSVARWSHVDFYF